MTNEMYHQKLRIHPRYRPYVIERDQVVVLYDNERPLILKGREAMSLVRCLLAGSCSAVDLVFELQAAFTPQAIVACLTRFLQQDILVYDDESNG